MLSEYFNVLHSSSSCLWLCEMIQCLHEMMWNKQCRHCNAVLGYYIKMTWAQALWCCDSLYDSEMATNCLMSRCIQSAEVLKRGITGVRQQDGMKFHHAIWNAIQLKMYKSFIYGIFHWDNESSKTFNEKIIVHLC